MAAAGNDMLSDVLTSLNEVKSRLQERLLQQPEYPALLIVDKAAFQLGEVLTLLRPQPPRLAANRAGGAATEASDEPAQAAHAMRGEDSNADASVAIAIAADQPSGAEPSFEPAETVALTDQPLAGDAGAIPATSGQAPARALPSYLPFFIAPRLARNNRY
jgi:hypothetical protein